MGAALCILAVIVFVFFVVGRGTGKTVADVENVTRKAGRTVATTTPKAAAKTVEVTAHSAQKAASVSKASAHKAADLSKTGATKAVTAAKVGGLVSRSVATQTRGVVSRGFSQFRENYREAKEAHNS